MSAPKKKNIAENTSNKLIHSRHDYRQLECVIQGFTKGTDMKKLYTTLFCAICGETKEVVAATNMTVQQPAVQEVVHESENLEEELSKAV